MPYPICSVVAGFKMLIRILIRSEAASGIWHYFFFLCFGSRRNGCNSSRYLPALPPSLIPPKAYWIHSSGANKQKIKRMDYWIHSSGVNKQKIKRINYNKCNVRASKKAGQVYFLSSSRYLPVPPLIPSKAYWIHLRGANKQKIKRIDHTNVMWEQVKMPNRHFLRSDIFTFVWSILFIFVCSLMN